MISGLPIGWGTDPILPLEMALVALAVIGAVLLLMRQPRLAVVVMLGPALLYALNIDSSLLSIRFGGISVYPADVVYSCALLAAIPLIVRNRSRLALPAVLLLVWFGLTLTLAAVGATVYSVPTAINEFRGAYYAIPPAVFVFAYFRGSDDINWLLRLWVGWAAVLCGVAILHWAQHGIGSSNSMVTINGQGTTGRGLPARASLDIAQAALLLMFAGRDVLPSARLRRTMFGVFIVVTILLQHRTVWLLLIVAVAVGAAMDPWSGGRRLISVLGSVYGAVAAVLMLALVGSPILAKFAASWHEIFKPNSTAMWRLNGWVYSLGHLTDWAQWLFGRPFGAGWVRLIDNKVPITDPPHNEYVQTMLRGGVVGLLLLALIYLLCWRSLHARRPLDIALRTILCAHLVYFVAYWLDMEEGILLGLCIVAATPPTPTWLDRWRGAQAPQTGVWDDSPGSADADDGDLVPAQRAVSSAGRST